MSSTPVISILMPVYNAAPFLEECIVSIINQSEKNWELIAINDFSRDTSADILSKFSHLDSRIKYYTNKEKGIIPALQLAYKKSKGQLITRMDADDIMPSNKLLELKKALQSKGKGCVSTGLVQYFSEKTLGDGYIKYQNWLNNLTKEHRNFDDIYKECILPSPCWMIHREDLDNCGAFNSKTYPEDYDLCFRFYKNNIKVIGIDKVLHKWRDSPTRSSRTDPNYANQQYFDLKLPYFLELDYDKDRPLILWGAGKKGKALAKKLIDKNIPFHWLTNNEKKQGKEINSIILKKDTIIKNFDNPQIIIAIAGPDDQKELINFLKSLNFTAKQHFHLFC